MYVEGLKRVLGRRGLRTCTWEVGMDLQSSHWALSPLGTAQPTESNACTSIYIMLISWQTNISSEMGICGDDERIAIGAGRLVLVVKY